MRRFSRLPQRCPQPLHHSCTAPRSPHDDAAAVSGISLPNDERGIPKAIEGADDSRFTDLDRKQLREGDVALLKAAAARLGVPVSNQ
jgi:hypothetical protein